MFVGCSHSIIVHPAQLASGDETPMLLVYLESTLSLGCDPIFSISLAIWETLLLWDGRALCPG
jgi:hypothetical protein